MYFLLEQVEFHCYVSLPGCIHVSFRGCIYIYTDVSKNSGTPNWMVKIIENPIKTDDLGVPLFLETPIYLYKCIQRFLVYIAIYLKPSKTHVHIYVYIYIYMITWESSPRFGVKIKNP